MMVLGVVRQRQEVVEGRLDVDVDGILEVVGDAGVETVVHLQQRHNLVQIARLSA